MRKLVASGAVVAASAMVFSMVSIGSADARTKKELNICWASADSSVALPVVADGPSYRTTRLAPGACKAWDVRPGAYKITVRDANAFLGEVASACDPGDSPSLTIRVKRAGQEYRDYSIATFVNGNIVTNVKKDRRTTIAAHLRCL